MAAIDEIRVSIVQHLAEIDDQVAALTAALEALDGDGTSRRGRARAVERKPPLGREARSDAAVVRSSKKPAQSARRSRRQPREVLAGDDVEATVDESADGLGDDDQAVLGYLQSWPNRPQAERWVPKLAGLSPSALAKLRRFVDQEIDRRRKGRRVGFTINPSRGTPTSSSRQLIEAGFVRLASN
jgi:hypothetical protein